MNSINHPVDQALKTRRSVRAFLPKDVPDELVLHLLELAARAPSGTNTQPWQVHVLKGEALAQLVQRAQACFNDPQAMAAQPAPYDYYPKKWVSPYLDRRRKVGFDLYALLGIGKADKEAMHRQHARNYCFFDAPVGLFFTIDNMLSQGSWLDYGMFLENIMIAARARGLDTCPQAAFTQFHRIIKEQLALPDNEMVVCGMSLGYADMSKAENRLVTEREPVSGFARFVE